jgi:hypothetical protein
MSNEIIRDLINQLPNKIKDKAMSTYAQIDNAGEKRGKEKVVINGWLNGISVDMLSKITGFTIEQVELVIEKYKSSKA